MKKAIVLIIFCLLLPVAVKAVDADNDGLLNEEELIYYTDPQNPDTDNDGYLDGEEVAKNYSPHVADKKIYENDYDNDGLNDWLEKSFDADIGKADTDGDGYNDGTEVMSGHDPLSFDKDIKFSRKIEVDRTWQRLYYFVEGIKLADFPVSTGNPGTQTPAGEFKITEKIENKRYIGAGYDLPNVLWNLEFKPGFYLHAAYWHNDFGKRTRSHGCVNLKAEDAKWLYQHVGLGTEVMVTGTTPKKFKVGA